MLRINKCVYRLMKYLRMAITFQFLHMWKPKIQEKRLIQSSDVKAQILYIELFAHISGLFALHPKVCTSVSSSFNGALNGTFKSFK